STPSSPPRSGIVLGQSDESLSRDLRVRLLTSWLRVLRLLSGSIWTSGAILSRVSFTRIGQVTPMPSDIVYRIGSRIIAGALSLPVLGRVLTDSSRIAHRYSTILQHLQAFDFDGVIDGGANIGEF